MNEQRAGRSALLLMDLQAGIISQYADPTYLARIQVALAAARRAKMCVIWVVVKFRSGYPEVSARNALFSGIRTSGRLTESDPQSEIHPTLQRQDEDVVVTKRRISAFSGSDLQVVLRSADVESLVLAGIATSGVVLSTLRQAADLDYRLTILKDGCCDADPEVHRVLTEKVFPRQATVVSIAEWSQSLAIVC